MRKSVLVFALLFSFSGGVAVASPVPHACSKCWGLRDAIVASRTRAAYAASWHYLSPAAQDSDWERERKLRAYLVREAVHSCGVRAVLPARSFVTAVNHERTR